MTISCTASRLDQGLVCAQRWAALAAVLVLTVCCPQQGAAQATIQVTTTQQGITVGQCSLQEAIYASEFKSNTAISLTNPDTPYRTGCTAGGGDGDIIVLAPGALYAFDHSWDGDAHNIYGPTATPIIFSKITIEGNGATLQLVDRFRPAVSRLFAIGTVNDPNFPSGTGELTLRNVYIKGFHINGGNGGVGGGGGGLGAGGAIYVHEGVLKVENSTFENNGAVGGNGGDSGSAGGGGGLSGNGGDGCPVSGGGGGGSRGNGGKGGPVSVQCVVGGGGGGGGGNVLSGGDGFLGFQPGGPGGFRCGGTGGDGGADGHDAACPGGGGGGGGGGSSDDNCFAFYSCLGSGARGGYGGGGGGGPGGGGQGGFGGGGGGGYDNFFSLNGGNGGFGGGGGSASSCPDGFLCFSNHPGKGGHFGGRADALFGGGGGALGGAIFSHNGAVEVRNSTFFNNFVTRGNRGGGSAFNGADAGGAIFAVGKSVEITDSTFSGNGATGSGAAIVVYRDDAPVIFVLDNNIIANNGAFECFFTGSVTAKGSGNLIMQNGPGTGPFSPCPGVVTTSDPQLQSLQLNSPGNTPTMAIPSTSPAVDKAFPPTSLLKDQRGVTRPQGAGFDIGAFELRSEDQATTWNPSDKGTNVTLSNGNLTFVAGWPAYDGVRAVTSASAGKKYWELTATTITSQPSQIAEGIANSSLPVSGPGYLGSDSNGIGWAGDGNVYISSAVVTTIQGWNQGDVLSFAVDLGSMRIWFRTNAGDWNNSAANDPATNTGGIDISALASGPYFAFGQGGNSGQRDTLTANFGGSAYAQSVPSGFGNW